MKDDETTVEEDKEYEVTLTFTGKTSLIVLAASPEEAAALAKCDVYESAQETGMLFFDVQSIHPKIKVKEYHEPKQKKKKQ